MKRFFAYNALVAAVFLLLWVVLVIVEVKIGFVLVPQIYLHGFVSAGLRELFRGELASVAPVPHGTLSPSRRFPVY
jgi:hypothetical protein